MPRRRQRPANVAWDLDGTLVDSGEAVPAALIRATVRLGAPRPTRADVEAAFVLGRPERILAHLIGRPAGAADAGPGAVAEYHRALAEEKVAAYPGIRQVLVRQRLGAPVAVFTSASRRGAEVTLATAGLRDLVDILVCAEDVATGKPSPAGLLLIAERFGHRAAELAYVGDSARDHSAARAAGALAVAASWGHEYRSGVLADLVLAAPSDAMSLFDH